MLNKLLNPQNKQTKQNKETTQKKKEHVKLLESKRSQAVGILISSQHLDSQLISDALINFDSQMLNYETLNHVYGIRPQEDDLNVINNYLKSNKSGEPIN